MAKTRLEYEDVNLKIVMMNESDIITSSIITSNAEDTEGDFFTPFFGN